MNNLPEMCFGKLKSTGEIILIKRYESGYYKQDGRFEGKDVDELNAEIGVDKGQRMAMEAGSMFGWDIPASNPDNYDNQGNFNI